MRIIIVDDDPIVCRSLKSIVEADPEMQVIGICYDGGDAVEMFKALNPDIVLMDIRMKLMNGIDAAQAIVNSDKDAKVIFLTTFSDTEYIVKALRLGAKGFILKQNFESIIPTVRSVFHGQRVFGDEIGDKIPSLLSDELSFDHSLFQLNEKESNILRLVANGLSNKEISQMLHYSEGTVRNYVSLILEKLGLRDRTQLAAFYYKHIHNSSV